MRRSSFLTDLAVVLILSAGGIRALGQDAARKAVRRNSLPATTLSDREKAAQLLNRFTFGPRPGDLNAVVKLGPQEWFEQQLNPSSVPDVALDNRLAEYPGLKLSSAQIAVQFPSNQTLRQIAEGRQGYPSDLVLASVYQVLEARYTREQQARKDEQTNQQTPDQIATQRAAQKKADRVAALTIAEQMLGTPKAQRMAAILKLPVEQRTVLAESSPDAQKKMLIAEFTPRERELFSMMGGGPDATRVVDSELQQAKVLRAILSERQLQEVMTDFWFNHFNVFLDKETDQIYTPAYERDVIRAHALGKFRDLLLATAQHPAMLVFLDNWQSIGPDSPAAGKPGSKQVQRGLNENYGREIMELHTVGVNGGYSQADVTSLAQILTGWTIDRPESGGNFVFDPRKHEPGDKRWFGQTIASQAGENGLGEGEAALTWLASRPQTAQFISYKLAQRFVADQPPAALVDRMARSFLASDGDIREVLRTMEHSPEFWMRKNYRTKVKTPLEFVASAFRATETNPSNPAAIVNVLKSMGEPLYQMQPPTGYPETSDRWMNSAALVDRLNFSLQLSESRIADTPFDAAHLLASGLLARGTPSTVSGMRRIAIDAAVRPVSGGEEALALLEQTIVGGSVSAKTKAVILKQISGDAGSATSSPAVPAEASQAQDSTHVLDSIAGLILGSPEFQLK